MTAELLFLTMLSLLNASVTAEAYWAYVPNPPMLHFVNWEENTIHAYVSEPKILGSPIANHIIPQAKMVNFMGWVVGIPICFTSIQEFQLCLSSGS